MIAPTSWAENVAERIIDLSKDIAEVREYQRTLSDIHSGEYKRASDYCFTRREALETIAQALRSAGVEL